MSPIFFSPGDSHTEGLLVLLHPGLEGVSGIDIYQKEGLCSLRLLSLETEFSMFVAIKRIK